MHTAEENILLHRIVRDLHYMARRYADGRSTYATRVFNQHTRDLLELGVDLNPTGDGTVWARDGMGRVYDGLTAAEAAQGRPIDEFRQTADMEDYTRLRAALGIIRDSYGQVCEEFEICRHTACWSSHGAWMMADMALKGETA